MLTFFATKRYNTAMVKPQRTDRRALLGAGVVAVWLATAGSGGAVADYVELGPSDSFALDQPRVAIEVIEQSAAGSPVSLGPEFSNTVLLDTGANGILLAGSATAELNEAGYETVAVYEEQGVAGSTLFDVSAPYRLDFAGDSGQRQTLSAAHIMSSPTVSLGGFDGVLGMPAMVGRVTTLDMPGLSDSLFIKVDFPPTVPADRGHRYRVPLTLVDFPQTGQMQADDPLPTWAPLPFAQVTLRNGSTELSRSFVVDTGAQISMIDMATALALGLDEDGNGSLDEEKILDLPIGGIGGEVTAPLLAADRISVSTAEGPRLAWTDFQFIVLDIDPSISGVLGMDLLTSGWLNKFFDPAADNGYIEQIHFDFRDAGQMTGSMLLDINPNLDVVVRELAPGDMDGDGDVDFDDVPALVMALSDAALYAQTYGVSPAVRGDLEGDGDFDFDDVPFFVMLLRGPSTAGVPEPGSLAIMFAAAVGFCLVLRGEGTDDE